MNKSPLTLAIISALAFGPGAMTQASETQASDGFVEGSSLKILNRNFYFNRDFRKGEARVLPNGERSSYTEAWAHGILANFESGFTQGTVGFGVDVHAGLGLKLDTGDGRYGPGGSVNLLPVDSDDRAEDAYSKVGAAVKARFADTVVKAGDVFPTTPVVHYGDSRLLPQSFKGVTLVNESVDGLTLQGGRLHAMSQPQESTSRGEFESLRPHHLKASISGGSSRTASQKGAFWEHFGNGGTKKAACEGCLLSFLGPGFTALARAPAAGSCPGRPC